MAKKARHTTAWGLSKVEYLVMKLLMNEGELYGLQMVEKADGALKRGTVYVTLSRMEEKGYITSRPEGGAKSAGMLPRRLYKPTGLGQRAYQALSSIAADLAVAT